jgi:hypothetical protein
VAENHHANLDRLFCFLVLIGTKICVEKAIAGVSPLAKVFLSTNAGYWQ